MSVKKAIESRYSVRNFNKDKKINDNKLETILNAGRLAPNGFGLEAWHFHVILGDKYEIMDACASQKQVGEAPVVIVVTVPTDKTFIHERAIYSRFLSSKGIAEEKADYYINALIERGSENYLREQAFFAVSQMVLQAQELKIGSCVVGGYNKADVEKVIGVDSEKNHAVLVLCLGYAKEVSQNNKNKRTLKEITTFIN